MLDFPSCFKVALLALSEYKMINSIYVAESERPLTLRFWNPPMSWHFEDDVDAAFKGLNEAAVGVIFRDENAAFTKDFSQKLEVCLDVLVAESTACLKGLLMVMNLNYHNLLVEMDCLELFHFLYSIKVPPIHAGNVIAGILNLSESFVSLEFRWIPRSANKVDIIYPNMVYLVIGFFRPRMSCLCTSVWLLMRISCQLPLCNASLY
ncbi:hypothetical protein C2S53_014512 [Perilla frutescens var. hirtella]|uniref:RNase H type-1 domain-containing protein n=1 Tax=Perilla frutescens var. hirtella TaxID=608512 RepID=A0AAD4P0Z0_PERFH|nr:hypothetical protein C2S53_014512 [Perilla frutescens var. hirtella]